MRNAVQRILAGEFHSDTHMLDFSSPRIELSVCSGEVHEGSFFIYGPENGLTEGSVSSNRIRMQCLTDEFSGSKEEIAYRFDASDLEEGECVKGEFSIISNRGEYNIPYEVSITEETIESSLGSIRNLFHFTNLAKTNWEEAVNLFYSENFKQIFRGPDKQYYSVYRGLSGGERRSQNVEEFLLEIKKKHKVEFILEEKEIRIDNPKQDVEYKITINRNGWGFSELHVEAEGDFLWLEKDVIREEDYLGNCYRLPFYIAEERLHGGRNFGTIRLFNAYTSMTVKVLIHQKPVYKKVPGIRMRKNHLLVEMMQYYEAFRTKKITAALWMQETEKILGSLVELDDHDASVRLFQVQLLITQERYNEAKWLLGQADTLLQGEFVAELYCYYLYLTTLLNREEVYTDDIADQVERIYTQNSDNWRIAWLLLYLSEDYNKSPSRKWMILEEQFRKGCKSPVLYIEAWNLMMANPTLLMRLEGFELQVLTYAAKKELLNDGVVEQIVYLAGKQKVYSERVFWLLEKCYQITPRDEVLQTICTLLIKGNRIGKEHFKWYAAGVEHELRITRLYEYYMMSCELTENAKIPKMVLMYFAFDSNLDSLRNAFLYTYVHQNRENFPELYESYKEQMERFTVFQILKGKNNKWLSYLYKNIVTPVMITEETAKGLATVLFSQKLTIKRNDIHKVILIYEKEREEIVYGVSGNEVYLPIYGSDFRILLEDGKHNRYCLTGDFELERLLIPDKLALLIAPYVKDEIRFDIWLCERGKALAVINDENVEQMKRITESDVLVETLQKEIRMRLIYFFYDHDRIQELDNFLRDLTPEMIENQGHAEVVRFMVIRGMYGEAYEWIKRRGGQGIDTKIIMRLCSRLISLELMEQDDVLTTLSYMAFQAGKYDEVLLTYLVHYFSGRIKKMRDIWKAARAFGIETYAISERILEQMLYTGAFVGEKTEIFKDYVSGGARSDLELSYLAQNCYDYFVGERVTDEFIMEDMQRAIEREEELPKVCKLAYTRYYAENKKQITEKISRYLMEFLRELLSEGLCFPYFKEYADHISFMRQFADKTIIQYKVEEGKKAVIHYLEEKESSALSEYIKEEMQDMFAGICVKQFILFFGERMQYYITEVGDDKESLTQSGTLNRNDTDREQKESKYNLINDIAISRTLHDDETMEHLLYEYFEQEFMIKKLFHTI